MASLIARLTFRLILAVLLAIFIFYISRPLYWKISATIHDNQQNKQTVSRGFSDIVSEVKKSINWYDNEESDLGVGPGIQTSRRMFVGRVV